MGIMEKILWTFPYAMRHMRPQLSRLPFQDLVGAWLGRISWDSRLNPLLVTDHSISVTGTSEKPLEETKIV